MVENNKDEYSMIKEYEEKILYLQKMFELLVQLNVKKNIEKEKGKAKIQNELQKAYKEIKSIMEIHKNNMINKIDDYFTQIQNAIIYKIQNKKLINNNNYIQMEKLNDIIKNQIPKVYEISNQLNIKNKENVESLKKIFNIEINQIKNNIIKNEQLLKENEIIMNDKIGKEIEEMITIFSTIKSKGEEYEQNMFSLITDVVAKMQYALS